MMMKNNVETLIERCENAINLAESIGSESIVVIGLDRLEGEKTIVWHGAEGNLVRYAGYEQPTYGAVFDAEELLAALTKLKDDELEAK
jgi:hypothetical protein